MGDDADEADAHGYVAWGEAAGALSLLNGGMPRWLGS